MKSHAICDSCTHTFKIKKIFKKLVTCGIEGQVTVEFFECPKCQKRYTTFVSNQELRRLIKEKKQIYSRIRGMKDPVEVEKAYKQFEELEKQAQKLHNRLKLKFKA